MIDAFAHLNWLAIALAALSYYVLGAVWFTPLFGKAWDRSIGHDRSRSARFGTAYYVLPLVSAVSVALALSLILAALTPTFVEALIVGAVIGLGVAAAISINNALTPHTPHPLVFGSVTGGYHLVGSVIVCAIVAAFPS